MKHQFKHEFVISVLTIALTVFYNKQECIYTNLVYMSLQKITVEIFCMGMFMHEHFMKFLFLITLIFRNFFNILDRVMK